MLAFFRRAFNSKAVLIILALIALAVVVTGVGTPNGLGFGGGVLGSGETIAKVGGDTITAPQVARRAEALLANARQQQPTADMAALVAQGGIESTVDQMVGARALEVWAKQHGLRASDRLVEGEIASVPAFAGPTGKFDEDVFRRTIAQAKITEPQLRSDIRGDVLRRMLLGPISGGAQAPIGMVTPYASLLLERRQGFAGVVPVAAIPAGPAPTAAEIAAWYKAHLATYTLPERRVLRTALISPDQVKAPAPTDAEVAADYRTNAATYAAKEQRTIAQLVMPGEAAARAAAAKIKSGASFASVAQAAGFGPTDTAIGTLDRKALADRSGPDVAAAAFALPSGGVSDAVRSSLGWAIVKVDAIRRDPGKTLDQARAEIIAKLSKTKREAAFGDLVGHVQDALDKGSTFDEVAKANGLAIVETPPLTAQGAAPGITGFKPPVWLPAIMKPAFDASADDSPSVEQLGAAGAVLLKVGHVIPSAPLPLAQVSAAAGRDLQADRAAKQARKIADTIAAKAGRGIPLAQALKESGLALPPVAPINARQADIARQDAQVPPALQTLFNLKQGAARVTSTGDGRAWIIVQLTQIIRGDATTQPQLIDVSKREFARILGEEYAQQFARAVQQELGTTRDAGAVARLKAALTSGQPVQ